jgi:hypothetical protein
MAILFREIYNSIEEEMDRKITATKKLIDKKMDKLVAMDKPRDKKIEKCGMVMKKKK